MERTIRFRGLTEGGDWVYGHYVYNRDRDTHYIVADDATGTEMCVSAGYGYAYAVAPESVGQYTGLTDKKGVDIYEGDIVIVRGNKEITKEEYLNARYLIEWDSVHAKFRAKYLNLPNSLYLPHASSYSEVIGNIHQNQQLISTQEMRISRFDKDLSVTGPNGTIKGQIIVTMNHLSSTVTCTHAVTHDDYKKTVYMHKVEGLVDGHIIFQDKSCLSERDVVSQVKNCEKQILEQLQLLANKKPALTFLDQMKELGFNS